LDDFLQQGYLKDVNPNLFGMIEQIILSHSNKFMGTWWSTFTGYSNRMRGFAFILSFSDQHCESPLLTGFVESTSKAGTTQRIGSMRCKNSRVHLPQAGGESGLLHGQI
jgi:hypothetical protein